MWNKEDWGFRCYPRRLIVFASAVKQEDFELLLLPLLGEKTRELAFCSLVYRDARDLDDPSDL